MKTKWKSKLKWKSKFTKDKSIRGASKVKKCRIEIKTVKIEKKRVITYVRGCALS